MEGAALPSSDDSKTRGTWWLCLAAVFALLLSGSCYAQNAYIPIPCCGDQGNNSVSMINTATNKVTATIPIGLYDWRRNFSD